MSLAVPAVAVVSTAVIWKGSVWLEEAAEKLADYYGLPAIVQGAVVAAVGSSFPELSSTVLATVVHGDFELGAAAIVGSAVFNILVIPAVATLAGEENLQADRSVVFKETQFYMLSVAATLVVFSFAVIYYPVSGAAFEGTLTRPLALLLVALYGLYVFVQFLDTRDLGETPVRDASPVRLWAVLAVSLVVIVVGVEGLGSNVFDLLVALPAGVLVAGATAVDFAVAVPMMAALVAATVLFFAVARTDLALTDGEAYGLLVAYAAFVAWLLLEIAGVTRLVG